jgi:hypothetical protein
LSASPFRVFGTVHSNHGQPVLLLPDAERSRKHYRVISVAKFQRFLRPVFVDSLCGAPAPAGLTNASNVEGPVV